MAIKAKEEKPFCLDIGCGPNPREGHEGVDQYSFNGKVKHVMDVRKTPWKWKTYSVDEIWVSHFIEHLTQTERNHFMNECFRIMKPTGKVTIIAPHWASNRAYGDPTHKWPAICEMWFCYLNRIWREANAPHSDKKHWRDGLDCDFDATGGYNLHGQLMTRNEEYRQFAMAWYKEAAQDIIMTLTLAKPPPKPVDKPKA